MFIEYYESVERHINLKLTFNRRTSKRLVNKPVSLIKQYFLEHLRDIEKNPTKIGDKLKPDDVHLQSSRGALADDDIIGTYLCRKEDLKLVHGMPPSRGHFPTRSCHES